MVWRAGAGGGQNLFLFPEKITGGGKLFEGEARQENEGGVNKPNAMHHEGEEKTGSLFDYGGEGKI